MDIRSIGSLKRPQLIYLLFIAALEDLGEKPAAKPKAAVLGSATDAAEAELSSLRKALSSMKVSLEEAAAAASTSDSKDDKEKAAAADKTEAESADDQGTTAFEDVIRAMTQSAAAAQAGGEDAEGEPDFNAFMAKIMQDMQNAQGGNDGQGDGEGEGDPAALMQNLLASMGLGGDGQGLEAMMKEMMESMTSKEVMYDSLCDLISKYPGWIAEKEQLPDFPAEELQKRKDQLQVMLRLKEEYDKEDPDKEKIMELLNEMHSYGPPPTELAPEDVRAGIEAMQASGGNPFAGLDLGALGGMGQPSLTGEENPDEDAMARQLEQGCKQQ